MQKDDEKILKEVLRRIEGYMKIKGISKKELEQKWNKNSAYIYRRLSGKVEIGISDMQQLCDILELTKEEAIYIFFLNFDYVVRIMRPVQI